MIDPRQFSRNTVQMLQVRPELYKSFGIYWWPVKAILKHFHSRDELYLLGDYEDPVGADAVPRAGLQEILAMAIDEHQKNLLDHMLPSQVRTPEGDLYLIYDEDAGV